jgi:acyl-CoA thioesterase I
MGTNYVTNPYTLSPRRRVGGFPMGGRQTPPRPGDAADKPCKRLQRVLRLYPIMNARRLASGFALALGASTLLPPVSGGEAPPATPAVPLAALTEKLTAKWPGNRTVNLVFHGHSVPAGYHRTPEVKPFDSYPHLVHRLVKDRHPHAVVNAIVTAIGGENSVSGAKRFAADVLTHRPDLVFIDYGLNDRRLPPGQVEAAWRAMAREGKAAGVPVVFVTPTGDSKARAGDPADPLNQRAELIRRIAAAEGVAVADVAAAWQAELARGTAEDDLLSQFNHPNHRGHELAAAVIAATILPSPP